MIYSKEEYLNYKKQIKIMNIELKKLKIRIKHYQRQNWKKVHGGAIDKMNEHKYVLNLYLKIRSLMKYSYKLDRKNKS